MKLGIIKNKSNIILLCLLTSIAFAYTCNAIDVGNTGGDTPAPTVASSVPANNSSLAINGNITLTFSEDIQAGKGNLTLGITGSDPTEIRLTDTTQVNITGKVLTINPSSNLTNDSNYRLTLPAGVITDTSNNPIIEFTLDFSTPPLIEPTITATAEVGGDIELVYTIPTGANAPTQVLIRQKVGSAPAVRCTDGTEVTLTNSQSRANGSITVTGLTDASQYFFRICGVVSSSKNSNGVSASATSDASPPTHNVAMSIPPVASGGSGDIEIDANIVLKFSENIKAGSGNITLVATGDSRTIPITNMQVTIANDTLTINPTNDLTDLSMYTLTLPAGVITDIVGNSNANFALTLNAVTPSVVVVLWAHTPNAARNGNLGNRTTADNLCKMSTNKPMVANGTITKAFLAYSSTDWPKTFTVNNMSTGTKLTEYTDKPTPVYGASSTTTTLTDANKLANNYNAFLTETTFLPRNLNETGIRVGSGFYWSGMVYGVGTDTMAGTADDVLMVSTTNCNGWTDDTTGTGQTGIISTTSRNKGSSSIFSVDSYKPMCSSTTDAGLLCITY